jgi:hypothetical protein
MYKNVRSKFDTTYSRPLPSGKALTEALVPKEEIELRDIIDCWSRDVFSPLMALKRIETPDKDHYISLLESRLKEVDKIFLVLLKNKAYCAALQRMLSEGGCSDMQQYLSLLLAKSTNARLVH